MTEPTDAELRALLPTKLLERDKPPKVQVWLTQKDALVFARAVLAKWGTPPAVAEPFGWLYEWTHSSATGRADETYTGFTKDEQHARKHDNCRAVYTTPQPTQAQAGAVPLPKSYQGSTLTSNSHDAGCRVSFSFSSVAEAEAWHESIVDQHHGIKGGQHG